MFRELIERLQMAWAILRNRDRDSNLVMHVKREVFHAGASMDMADAQDASERHTIGCTRAMLDLARLFSAQGHSGLSAGYTLRLFEAAASFRPLSPLNGDESEWTEVGPGVFQNRRCGNVFREGDHAYDIDGFVFVGPDGVSWTNQFSRRTITEWPYQPARVYIEMEQDSPEPEDYEAAIKAHFSELVARDGCCGHTVH